MRSPGRPEPSRAVQRAFWRLIAQGLSTENAPGLAVGDVAELLLLDGETVTSAIMDRPSDRTVIHAGRVVADQLDLV